jgi:hypothetical protein
MRIECRIEVVDKTLLAHVVDDLARGVIRPYTHRGNPNDAYILKRLKNKAVRRSQQFTEDDEEFVGKVIRLVEDGLLPRATAKRVATSLRKPDSLPPLKVLAVLRRDIKPEFFQASPIASASQALAPREVILSSYLVKRS